MKCSCTGCPKKSNLISKLYFEAAKLLKSEILAFSASLELYNSFDTLFVCFHGLMNNLCRKLFSRVSFSQNWNSKEFFQRRTSNKLMLQVLNRDSYVHSNRHAKMISIYEGDKENRDFERIFGNLINDIQDICENIKSPSEKP